LGDEGVSDLASSTSYTNSKGIVVHGIFKKRSNKKCNQSNKIRLESEIVLRIRNFIEK
jgi:hypothetical protein